MPRVKRVTVSGDVLEQEIFYVAPNTQNLRSAEPRPLPHKTEEEKEEYNRKQSLKRFIRTVNATFNHTALYTTQTFDDLHLPPDFPTARRILNNYFRRLKRLYPKMKAIAVMGRGRRTSRIHIHCIISGVPEQIIFAKWKGGKIARIEHLRKHNFYEGVDHGQDYKGLATYLFNHWTPEQGGNHWKPTKNLEKPDRHRPTIPKRCYTLDKPPVTPKGYTLVEKHESPNYTGGYLCFRYVRIPPPITGTDKLNC